MRRHAASTAERAQLVLYTFIITFFTIRFFVFLGMAGKIDCIYLGAHGFHVHHFVYGIILLTLISGYMLFKQPLTRVSGIAVLYGVALAFIYDEFAIFFYVTGHIYWAKISLDAIVILASVLAIIAFMPAFKDLQQKHKLLLFSLFILVLSFVGIMISDGKHLGKEYDVEAYHLEYGNHCHS